MPIKDFIHHYPRALFNDIPMVGAHFYDIPGSGRTFTTYPGRDALLRHTRVGTHFYDIPGSGRSLTTYPGQDLYQTFLFLSKVIEKVISIRILGHILDNNIVDNFQSAYRAGHSCETAILREKYVGIDGSALRLIRSHFSNRTQRVQIDGIMSDFASLLCGVPQGSVLGQMKFYLYLLPLGAILRHHNIGYHIYADDTQLYISFKCKDPLESLTKLNMYISDIRLWMIKNKLKINDSKTEFIIFRSPL